MLEQRDGKQEEGKVLFEVQACKGLWHIEPFVGNNGQRWNVQSELLRWSEL